MSITIGVICEDCDRPTIPEPDSHTFICTNCAAIWRFVGDVSCDDVEFVGYVPNCAIVN
jgi:hypothetical protein